jgi:hypothetical protein
MVSTLLRFCGPAILASTLSDEQIARAVREHRAMRIYVDSCMGTRDCGLSTTLVPGERPDVVFTNPIPDELSDVGDPFWDYRDDVLRAIDLLPPRRKPGRPRTRPLAHAPREPAPLDALAEDERAAVRSALDAIAQRRATADADGDPLHGTPARDIVLCEGERARRTVVAVLDHMIWHMVQSGSDTFEHHVYVVEVVLAEGVPVSELVQRRRKVDVSEYDERSYDREKVRREVVAELQRKRVAGVATRPSDSSSG